MIANFASTISGFASASPITRQRQAAGTDSFGIRTPGAVTSTVIVGCFVRGYADELLLPAGERTNEVGTLYTAADLQTVQAPGGAPADKVQYEGEVYEVTALRNWSTHGGFVEAACTKVTQ